MGKSTFDALGRVSSTQDESSVSTAYRRVYGYTTDATAGQVPALSALDLWPNDANWHERHYAVTEARYNGNTLAETIIRVYDRLHRLKAVAYKPAPVSAMAMQYFAYDVQGRLKFSANVNAALGGWSSVGMEYDVWGRLTHDRQSWQAPNGDKDGLSNPGGAVDAAMSYGDTTAESGMSGWQEVAAPSGPTYRLTFDDRRQVSKVSRTDVTPATEWAKYGYEPGGELVREELPGNGGTLGNLWSRVEFDGQGRESRRRYVDVNTSRFEQSSAYDAVGNVVDRREVQTRDSALERRYLFELDKLNRVTKQADGTSSTPPSLGSPRYQWTFDAADNWLTTTQDTPGSTWEREINAQNEYTRIKRAGQPDVAVGHDWRGNTAQHGDRLYMYDWDNRLVSVMDTNDNIVYQYAYDALGRLNCRLKYDEYGQPLPYEFLHYAGRGLVTTYQSGVANSQRWFITSPRTGYLVGMWVDGPDEGTDPDQFHAALHNSRGDVSALTQNGVVSESYHYSTYGRRTVFNGSGTTAAHDSPLGNVIGLTGQISLGDNTGINCDPESYFSSGTPRAGLWHMNARTYSPSLGRFVQRDPSGFADGTNLYAYTGNDPWTRVDPLGTEYVEVSGGKAYWITEHDGTFVNRDVARREIGTVSNGTVVVNERFGGGTASLAGLRKIAGDYWKEYGDFSGTSSDAQVRAIGGAIDRVQGNNGIRTTSKTVAGAIVEGTGQGVAQGGLNSFNGLQDAVIGIGNLVPLAYNVTVAPTINASAGLLGYDVDASSGYIPSPDWSRDVIVDSRLYNHSVSKFAGGQGLLTGLTLGASQLSTASRLVHLTSEAGAEGIGATNIIKGSGGIFGLTRPGATSLLRTGQTFTRSVESTVEISGKAAAAFKGVPVQGPIRAWQALTGGARFAEASSVNLATGATTPLSLWNGTTALSTLDWSLGAGVNLGLQNSFGITNIGDIFSNPFRPDSVTTEKHNSFTSSQSDPVSTRKKNKF